MSKISVVDELNKRSTFSYSKRYSIKRPTDNKKFTLLIRQSIWTKKEENKCNFFYMCRWRRTSLSIVTVRVLVRLLLRFFVTSGVVSFESMNVSQETNKNRKKKNHVISFPLSILKKLILIEYNTPKPKIIKKST